MCGTIAGQHGSTKSGIAPFYSDKFAKIGFQVNELYDDTDSLRKKLERILEVKNLTIKNLYHKEELSVDEIFNKLMEYKEMLEPYVASTFDIVNDAAIYLYMNCAPLLSCDSMLLLSQQ